MHLTSVVNKINNSDLSRVLGFAYHFENLNLVSDFQIHVQPS